MVKRFRNRLKRMQKKNALGVTGRLHWRYWTDADWVDTVCYWIDFAKVYKFTRAYFRVFIKILAQSPLKRTKAKYP